MKAAKEDDWSIDRISTASDGIAIVELETGATMTEGQSERLLERIRSQAFGDIALGMAPRKVSKSGSLDE